MRKSKKKRNNDRNRYVENEFVCENIFKASQIQPYLDSTQGGKWGRGKDDSPVDEGEFPDRNNPLPY